MEKRKVGRPVGTIKSKYPRKIGGSKGKPMPMYSIWQGMLNRCHNPKTHNYAYYGGRGITVCDRWRGDLGYDNFVDDMGVRPAGMSIERKKNDEGYSPENCCWATWSEQARNRRNNHAPKNVNSLMNRARLAGLPYTVAYQRIKLGGWSEQVALTTPIQPRGRIVGRTAAEGYRLNPVAKKFPVDRTD